ncbi:hypothetical protein [uncultured Acetatifactor sp.]|jgi:hypothetical protein|uniref:hypothetical protein n=1 Tax=uncultured Acetatifactor sp. TaxID=1671927 RepID=UPI002611A4DD|nr:hypothetical protein [uncultured Acetatifactor sp.]
MALTNAFREAVTEKNVRKIRIMLKDSLLVDPSFKRFQEMERAASLVEGLYDVHDGRGLTEDKEAWNDAYMDRLMVQVVSNFSHERIEHLKEVVRHQRPVPQRIAQEPQDDRSTKTSERFADGRNIKSEYQAQKLRDQMSGDYRRAQIVKGVSVGGLGGGLGGGLVGAGAHFSATGIVTVGAVAGGALVGALAGALAGGAVAYVATGRK